MFVALNKEKRRIDIKDAAIEDELYCPICGKELIKKSGNIRIAHFAHRAGECTDKWNYDMSEWHYNWQEQFPSENREVVFEKDGKKHRADIFIKNTIIEFQHSKLSEKEFKERNNFYLSLGYKVIWVFDVIEDFSNEKIYNQNSNIYLWNNPIKTFLNFEENKNLIVFLQTTKNTWDYDKYYFAKNDFYDYGGTLLKTRCRSVYNDYSYFECDKILEDIDIISAYTSTKKNKLIQIDEKTKIKYDVLISDKIYYHSKQYNPNSVKLYCPMVNKYINDNECMHACAHLNSNNNRCIYRFQKLLRSNIEQIIEVKKDKNDRVSKICCIINKNKVYINFSAMPLNQGTILELWNEHRELIEARFFNVKTGASVKVKNVDKMIKKYNGKCYGIITTKNGETSDKSIEIVDHNMPVWVLI